LCEAALDAQGTSDCIFEFTVTDSAAAHDGPAATSSSHRGAYFALASAALFGASAPLAKSLLTSISPQLLAGLLYLGSGIGLATYRLLRGARSEATLGGRDLAWLAGAIALGGVAGPLLLMIGLARTPASGASLLLNLEGVFTALLAWFVFHENFDRRIALGMVAIVAGGILLAWEGYAAWGGLIGPLSVAGACLCWAADNNLTQESVGW
jgi:drug/metabolite transporter (DMT)-like permease